MLIIIIAHMPIFTLQRQEGRIFAPMAYTIVSALIGSLLFSLTLVPLLAYFLLRSGVPHGENIAGPILQSALPAGADCRRFERPVLVLAGGRQRRWREVCCWPRNWAANSCPS